MGIKVEATEINGGTNPIQQTCGGCGASFNNGLGVVINIDNKINLEMRFLLLCEECKESLCNKLIGECDFR